MSCAELRPLIDGYFDEELDLVRSLELEKHLDACPTCAGQLARLRALRSTLRGAQLHEAAPDSLRRWAESLSAPPAEPARGLIGGPFSRWPWLSAAAAAVLLIGFAGVPPLLSSRRAADEIVAIHVRSLMAQHLTDVASSDQHTVKPWFNGKIDFAPAVRDFAENGFPLKGGRLEYAGGRAAAALVYERHQHVINLVLWPESSRGDQWRRTLTRRGYHLAQWRRAGIVYWAVSDLNQRELLEFCDLIQSQPAS